MRELVDSPLAVARNYLDLTKPRLLPMVLFTALPVFGMSGTSGSSWPAPTLFVLVLLGIALAAASANTLNAWVERETDALMERTCTRPLPEGRIRPAAALIFGVVLGLLSTLVLYASNGLAVAGLGVASILFYVFVYTIWLKPRSIWNAVIGGAAGAAAPLIADVAIHGSIGAAGLSLFAIVFFWQPPHVWAIALYRRRDYEAAGIPMPPSVIGDAATRRWIVAYTLGLVPVTLAPVFFGLLGNLYLVVALGVSAWFVRVSVRLLERGTEEAARSTFRVSLAFLAALFVAMLADLLV